jgi:hypothetical protein
MAGKTDADVDTSALTAFVDRSDSYDYLMMKAQRLCACWSTDFHLDLTGVPPFGRSFAAE